MSFQNQAGLDAEIESKLPSNDAGAVTAAALRQVLHDMNAAIFQVASSQGLSNSVFQYGAAGDGSTNDAAAFVAALAANSYAVAPPASYRVSSPRIVVPAGVTLETQPGASIFYAAAGLGLSPGGSFITKTYGDQKEQWLWARSFGAARSTTQDTFGFMGRTGAFDYGFACTADTGQTSGIVNNLVSFQQFGGSTTTGARAALLGYAYQSAKTSSSNTFRDYVGMTCIAETDTGDGGTGLTLNTAAGSYFGGDSQSRLNAGATNIVNATAHEFDVYNAAGCSMVYNWGINVVSFNSVQGASNDAAVVVYSGNASSSNGNTYGPGVGFHFGLCFAEVANAGLPPVDSGATLIGTHLETLSTFAAATGVDLTKFVFSGNAYQSNNFAVAQSGNVSIGGVTGAKLQVSTANAFDGVALNGTGSNAIAYKLQQGGTNLAWLGAALAANQWVTGTAAGDVVFRQDSAGGTMWFSVDAGASTHLKIGTSVLTVKSSAVSVTYAGGLQVGTPTGGDLGAGKINVAGGIYLNNTAYTNPDYVFEKHFTGKIEKYADKPRADTYRGLMAIPDLVEHVTKNLRLPGISDEPADIFERTDIALEKLEEQTLYIFALHDRMTRLEQRLLGKGGHDDRLLCTAQ